MKKKNKKINETRKIKAEPELSIEDEFDFFFSIPLRKERRKPRIFEAYIYIYMYRVYLLNLWHELE